MFIIANHVGPGDSEFLTLQYEPPSQGQETCSWPWGPATGGRVPNTDCWYKLSASNTPSFSSYIPQLPTLTLQPMLTVGVFTVC